MAEKSQSAIVGKIEERVSEIRSRASSDIPKPQEEKERLEWNDGGWSAWDKG